MHIAIINEETNIVENITVPPEGATAWFVGQGYIGVETDTGNIGDTYNPQTEEFIKPQIEEPEPEDLQP